METLEIIKYIIIGLVAICLVIYYINKAIKEKWVEKISDTVKIGIKEAEEKFPEKKGKEKLAYVLSKVEEKCKELGIPYNIIYSLIVKLINRIIEDYNVISKN